MAEKGLTDVVEDCLDFCCRARVARTAVLGRTAGMTMLVRLTLLPFPRVPFVRFFLLFLSFSNYFDDDSSDRRWNDRRFLREGNVER